MATGITWSTLFLGNIGEMDTDEESYAIETASPILTSFGGPSNPLYNSVTTVTTSSTNDDDVISSDNVETSDMMSYDLGTGPVTVALDNAMMTKGNVTFSDGSELTATDLAVMQDDTGNAFLLILDSQSQLASKMIESVEFTSITNSNYSGVGQYNVDSLQFLCLASGTMITTPTGEQAVEHLEIGDRVATLSGPLAISAIFRRSVNFVSSPSASRPVRIRRGSFGCDLPFADLDLSAQHRVVLGERSPSLVASKALVDLTGVRIRNGCRTIRLHAVLLPRHAIISANGLAVESLLPGRQALAWLTGEERAQYMKLVGSGALDRCQRPAFRCKTLREAKDSLDQGARPVRFSDMRRSLFRSPNGARQEITQPRRGSRP